MESAQSFLSTYKLAPALALLLLPTAAVVARARSQTLLSLAHLRFALVVLGGLLAFIAVVQAGLSVVVIQMPQEANTGEALVYGHAARLLRGEPLYQPLDRPPYTVANYTPLYYLLTAELQALVGPGFGPGRSLSFVAGLIAAGLVATLAASRARARWAGAFAALLFLALGLPVPFLWSALYRVDLLGVMLSLGAVSVLAGGTSRPRLVLAGTLAALAVLTKQAFFAAGLAGAIWLWRRDRPKAALFTAIWLSVVLGACLFLEVSTGAFLANAVVSYANPFAPDVLKVNVAFLVLRQGGPLAITILDLRDRRATGERLRDDLLVLYWAAAALPVAGLAKVGSNQNYWIEWAAVNAILASCGIWDRLRQAAVCSQPARALIPMLLLGTNLVVTTPGLVPAGLAVPRELGAGPSQAGEFTRLVQRVRTEPGEVLAEPLDVLALAGRPILFEPGTSFGVLYQEGLWNPSPVVRRICRGEVGLLVLGRRLESDSLGLWYWTGPILAALRETMVLQSEQAGRFLYVPRGDIPTSGCRVLTE